MRSLVVVLLFFLLFGVAQITRAYYYDDSVVIEIGDGVPTFPTSTPPSGGSSPGNGSGGGAGGSDPGTGSEGGVGTGDGAQGSTGGNEGNTSSGGSGEPSAGSSLPSSFGSEGDSLFDLLVTQGAITAGNSSVNSNAGSGVGGANADASNSGETSINAAKLRSALLGKESFKQILEDYSNGYRAGKYRMLSARDLGLMGASIVLGDTNIHELTFGATKFEMVYRSRGYLLGFIPKTFPLRIAVDPQASVAQRVVLTLPWYRFLLRKLFRPSVLAREIDTIVTGDVPLEGDTSVDVQARLFDSISFALKQKIGAVGVN